jgi:hypothetical protein
MSHIERKSELRRRRHRRAKIKKLRARLEKTKNPSEVQSVLTRIKKLNPFWEPRPKTK